MAQNTFIHTVYRAFRKLIRDSILFVQSKRKTLKLVIGASGIADKGWIATNIEQLNILETKSWNRFFKTESVDAMLAEHVWEHLTLEEAFKAAKNCFQYLKTNGYIRVAVPDGLHSSQMYVNSVKPGGSGAGSEDHKVLYDYKSLSNIFETAGFRVILLEYFDEQGVFHDNPWDAERGLIHRSKMYDSRNCNGQLNYTSVIIDAVKY
jgi:predicted SAM-dependent methyltransferase